MTTDKRAWWQVMEGLRGDRLALFDEMLCNGSADLPESVDGALAWLVYHQFAWLDSADRCARPRPIAKAREHWEAHGPAEGIELKAESPELSAESPEAITSKSTITSTREPERWPVQPHQVEIFALEGY